MAATHPSARERVGLADVLTSSIGRLLLGLQLRVVEARFELIARRWL